MSRLSCLTIAVMFRMCSSRSCLANRSPPPLFCILCSVETMSSLMRKACSTRAAVVFSWLRILSSSWSTRLADASGTAVSAWLCSGMFRTRLGEQYPHLVKFSHKTLQCLCTGDSVTLSECWQCWGEAPKYTQTECPLLQISGCCVGYCVSCTKAGQVFFMVFKEAYKRISIIKVVTNQNYNLIKNPNSNPSTEFQK